jgi:hypothetical protein
MAEDLQTGPVSSKRRPAIGARLAMLFLAVVGTLFVLIAAVLLAGVLVILVLIFFVEESGLKAILPLLAMMVVAGLLTSMAAGAKWIEGMIRQRHTHPSLGGSDPAIAAGQQVVMTLEIVLVLSGFGVVVWIPAEISGMKVIGAGWPAFWLLVGGLSWWGRREISKRLTNRALSRDRGPCSMPGTPPSGAP